MRFDFDPGKDATNLSKHGLSLAAAAELDWDAALVWIDNRADYGEARMIALAPIGDILFFVAFVDREPARRIISLRRANRREVRHYVKAIKEDQPEDADT
ncbi:BrnT family toxin [Synechococcus sp. L2F]|uniref:BrnT family toxin n=1 Tax=Synechococcus sp. L2F TaxID=2823739 RepID=UPI0020CF2ABE|nr:BrnT family toxin [Synechococcus sp. L2F]MCP9828022.1 BrnT family toxin [Synechococcus sp. L2F]